MECRQAAAAPPSPAAGPAPHLGHLRLAHSQQRLCLHCSALLGGQRCLARRHVGGLRQRALRRSLLALQLRAQALQRGALARQRRPLLGQALCLLRQLAGALLGLRLQPACAFQAGREVTLGLPHPGALLVGTGRLLARRLQLRRCLLLHHRNALLLQLQRRAVGGQLGFGLLQAQFSCLHLGRPLLQLCLGYGQRLAALLRLPLLGLHLHHQGPQLVLSARHRILPLSQRRPCSRHLGGLCRQPLLRLRQRCLLALQARLGGCQRCLLALQALLACLEGLQSLAGRRHLCCLGVQRLGALRQRGLPLLYCRQPLLRVALRRLQLSPFTLQLLARSGDRGLGRLCSSGCALRVLCTLRGVALSSCQRRRALLQARLVLGGGGFALSQLGLPHLERVQLALAARRRLAGLLQRCRGVRRGVVRLQPRNPAE